MKRITFAFVLVVIAAGGLLPLFGDLQAIETGKIEPATPQSDKVQQFQELLENSPFTRSLNLSDTLVLTGVARVDGKLVATILDTEDGLSLAVSDLPNYRGWKMIELSSPDDLEFSVASVEVRTGDVFKVRYEKERIEGTAQRLRYATRARIQRKAAEARARSGGGGGHGIPRERVDALRRIDRNELPKGYNPGAGRNKEESHRLHQTYVDNRLAGMSDRQKGTVGRMWNEKKAVDPGMSNRGASFVRIMEHVAENEPR